MSLTIGVPRETFAGEKRVAAAPEVVEKLIKLGFSVRIESGAGDAANFSDSAFVAAGASIAANAAELYSGSSSRFALLRLKKSPPCVRGLRSSVSSGLRKTRNS
jgi:NAD(P) transhydrogenase subunit alpha